MPQLIDCYFLVETRSHKIVNHFCDEFLPKRRESAEDYPVPIYADTPDVIFQNIELLLQYLEQHLLSYSVYWENSDRISLIKHGMVFYTEENNMIVGVSIAGNEPCAEEVIFCFNQIKTYLNADIGCITVEEAPPSSVSEFKSFCEVRFKPR